MYEIFATRKNHPILIECECHNTLHKLCGSDIIRGGAIDCRSIAMSESDGLIVTYKNASNSNRL